MLIRLKVPCSSCLFFVIRVKKLQLTSSSRLNSFATNSSKVLIDFTHSAPVLLSVKKFFESLIILASFLALTRTPQSKLAVKIAPLNQSEILSYKS